MKKWIGLLFLAAFAAQAQHEHHAAANTKPAELLEGLGNHTHPIATKSKLAQQFFDQGLALIYGFNHDEAARLFARAAELDPASPMPHWGIALALGPNYNMPPMPEREAKAWEAIDKAVALSANAPENERAYVKALVKRYSKDPEADRKQLAVFYKDAMKDVAARYPDDLDAATLYAESLHEPASLGAVERRRRARRRHSRRSSRCSSACCAATRITPARTTTTSTPSKLRRVRSARCPARCGSVR